MMLMWPSLKSVVTGIVVHNPYADNNIGFFAGQFPAEVVLGVEGHVGHQGYLKILQETVCRLRDAKPKLRVVPVVDWWHVYTFRQNWPRVLDDVSKLCKLDPALGFHVATSSHHDGFSLRAMDKKVLGDMGALMYYLADPVWITWEWQLKTRVLDRKTFS